MLEGVKAVVQFIENKTLSDFFTDLTSNDTRLWTAGFLNERFPEPVSPLGWTLIRDWFEELALRGPLRYLGVQWPAGRPLTRLYRGHPYADAEAFWTLYKLFPDSILPDDAVRYFPGGLVALRKTAPRPASIVDPRLWGALGRSMLSDLGNWSPWHNWRAWQYFESRLVLDLKRRTEDLESGGGPSGRAQVWAALQEAQGWNGRLLSLHRWSLTHADLTYTLLRRLVNGAVGPAQMHDWSARLVAGSPNWSLRLDAALARLGAVRRSEPGDRFDAEFAAFLASHGHRSFSLDLLQPTFEAQPAAVLALLDQMDETSTARESSQLDEAIQAKAERACGRLRQPILSHLVGLARIYMGLREDQRYRWQQILALMRQLVLRLAEDWVRQGQLDAPDDAFFVTWAEFSAAAQEQGSLPDHTVLRARRERFAELGREYRADPARHYPAFLKGDAPCADSGCAPASDLLPPVYWGRAASPGIARGPVRRVVAPRELVAVESGEVLLARTTDPGWTPVFRRIAALVTETGGLLSHGAVVAREYGLPAVVAAVGTFEGLHDGQWVEVDGGLGKVSVLNRRDELDR
jgi:phosphohistidine swiveling domain-containing protein